MKRRWLPFLLKLFGPGLLALPWLLDIWFEFIPKPEIYSDSVEVGGTFLQIWTETVAYTFFFAAVLFPVFLIRKYKTIQKTIISLSWFFILGTMYFKEIAPSIAVRRALFFERGEFLFLILLSVITLLTQYFILGKKRDQTTLLRLNYLFQFLFQLFLGAIFLIVLAVDFKEIIPDRIGYFAGFYAYKLRWVLLALFSLISILAIIFTIQAASSNSESLFRTVRISSH
ncbi:MAG: hypothetical protein R3B47_14070 [Bacteroidia bacterium]